MRNKSYNDLLRQTSQLLSRAGGGSQPINHLSKGRIISHGNTRMRRIADIFNRYADNLSKENPDLALDVTDKESSQRLAKARERKMPQSVYREGKPLDTRKVEYRPVDAKARREELRRKYADRMSNASKGANIG